MMASAGTTLTPTLGTRPAIERHASDPRIPSYIVDKIRATQKEGRSGFEAALVAGVSIIAGTDAGSTFVAHGSLASEIRQLHDAGLPVRDALAAATSLAAREVGFADGLGSLRPGVIADIIVLDGNPLLDLSSLERIALVVQAGRLVSGKLG